VKSCFIKISTVVCLLAPLAGFAQSFKLLTSFTNSRPGTVEYFGRGVAPLGSDRVLIGAPGDNSDEPIAGVAYLFSTNGILLATFTNPTPQTDDEFGRSIVALGNDRVLIGAPYDSIVAPNSGIVYLFNTNGTLLNTITNPTPAVDENFGLAIAALGSDRVVVGAPYDSLSAYLFDTNGTLLATFANSTSGYEDNYGFAVAAVGNDHVLIGALSAGEGVGSAYLFNTNGALVTTFINPISSQVWFGLAVAGMGSDRVLINGHLFSTNGTLLTIFPTMNQSYFGVSVSALGSDRVLIGSVGAAFVFSTNGTLLSALNNPNGAGAGWFGNYLAAVGSDRVLIGAYREQNVGAAYLFSVEIPRLSVMHSGGGVIVSWPKTANDFVLDETQAFVPPPATTSWSQVSVVTYQTNATSIFISVPGPSDSRFYRLRKL
jgi:hypothetical protein